MIPIDVEFRQRRPSDIRSERCSQILLSWFPASALIVLVFIFAGHIWGSVVTVVVVIFMVAFTCFYFHLAPPETEPNIRPRSSGAEPSDVKTGLSPSDLNAIPEFAYQRINKEVNNGVGWVQCAVCIATVKEGEMVRELPICQHKFHVKCIDEWLGSHSTCPMCRADVKTGEVSDRSPPV